jgi:hypothetical protein
VVGINSASVTPLGGNVGIKLDCLDRYNRENLEVVRESLAATSAVARLVVEYHGDGGVEHLKLLFHDGLLSRHTLCFMLFDNSIAVLSSVAAGKDGAVPSVHQVVACVMVAGDVVVIVDRDGAGGGVDVQTGVISHKNLLG